MLEALGSISTPQNKTKIIEINPNEIECFSQFTTRRELAHVRSCEAQRTKSRL
jgi:hypothetical protein